MGLAVHQVQGIRGLVVVVDSNGRALLSFIATGRDLDELVGLPMQYTQILTLLRSMIAEGLVERTETRLVLTESGHDAMLNPAWGRVVTPEDPLEIGRMPKPHPDAVHLPRGVVK